MTFTQNKKRDFIKLFPNHGTDVETAAALAVDSRSHQACVIFHKFMVCLQTDAGGARGYVLLSFYIKVKIGHFENLTCKHILQKLFVCFFNDYFLIVFSDMIISAHTKIK